MKRIVLLILIFSLVSVACNLFDSEITDFEDASADEEVAEEMTDTTPPTLDTETSDMPAEFSAGDCPFDLPGNYDVECGYLTVPENRTLAQSPTIELAVAIVNAPDSAAAEVNAPVVYLAGGPGGSALDDFAADVAVLREALGINEWDLLGISYGTRLALEIMHHRDGHHPAGIRSVILDSPFPPNIDMPLADVYSMTDALTELFADCERDEYCSETYPDLEDLFLETVQRLNEDETAKIFGDDLVFALSSAFSETELIPLLPYVINEVAGDNFEALDEIAAEGDFSRRLYQDQDADFSDSEGMYNAVICFDEYVDGDYERVESAVVGTIPEELEGALLQGVFDLTQVCSYWNPMDAVDNTAVASDIPVLILSGQYDVATPPSWAELTATTLNNAYLFVFPGAGHSLLSGVDCAISMTTDFLDNPAQEPSSQCVDNIEWPYFE